VRLLLALLAATACGLLDPDSGTAAEAEVARFIRRHGGVQGGELRARLDRVARPLLADPSFAGTRVGVLATDAVAAYAWPSRIILVTRGLLAVADEEQLAAAVAHELGHLVDGHHLSTRAALRGAAAGDDAEQRADVFATALLAAHHLPETAMARLLCVVRAAARLPADQVAQLDARIRRLAQRNDATEASRSTHSFGISATSPPNCLQ
jgi:predicted Zn-dependent protease